MVAVCDPCRKPLAVDRWLHNVAPHELRISAEGTRKEKEVCVSCFEYAAGEMDSGEGWRGALAEARADGA